VTNFSAKSTRRIDLVIGCGYNDNLKEVKTHLESLIQSKELILKDPEPVIAVAELGDSSVNFVVRPWVKSEDYWAVRWELLEEIKTSFDEKGFSIPYPQRDVHIHNAKEV
jgi:small conductance mechanosensitive channel